MKKIEGTWMPDTLLQLDKEDKQLIVRYPLDTCEQCGEFMLQAWGDTEHLPKRIISTARVMGIKEEHYRKWNVCDECINLGNYTEQCEICSVDTPFPELAFELAFYPKYPDDDTRHEFICKQCSATRAQQTIDAILAADGVKDLRK